MPGMVMVGRMGDDALKARVAALCTDLSADLGRCQPAPDPILRAHDQPTQTKEGRAAMEPMKPMEPMDP